MPRGKIKDLPAYNRDLSKDSIVCLAWTTSRTHCTYKCLLCKTEFTSVPDDLSRVKCKCPNCRSNIENYLDKYNTKIKDFEVVCLNYFGNGEVSKYRCNTCKKEFETRPFLLDKARKKCPHCRSAEGNTKSLTDSEYMERVNSKFGCLVIVAAKYQGSRTRIEHICKHHGSYFSAPDQVLNSSRGNGCAKCKSDKASKRTVSFSEFKRRMSEIDSSIRYVRGYSGIRSKAVFKCKTHKLEWEAMAANVLNGHGCPNCRIDRKTTKHFKRKEIKLGSRVRHVLGYEPILINRMLERGVKPSDIQCGSKNIPTIRYMFGGVERFYFPDIYRPSVNTLYEVKSTYTLFLDFEKNLAKAAECERQGFIFKLILISESGRITTLPKYWHTDPKRFKAWYSNKGFRNHNYF